MQDNIQLDQILNKFSVNLVLKTIINYLKKDDASNLFTLIIQERYQEANMIIDKKIPDLPQKIVAEYNRQTGVIANNVFGE